MTYKSDEELQGEVVFQLGWDSRVKRNEVGVSVCKSVVTLTGTVDSYAKKLAAQQAAHRVAGVLDVANDIEVRAPGDKERSDADIARALRHALEWNVLVPASRIHSTVSNGWVTLKGEVECYRERVDAERAVSVLPGVRGVFNEIQVKTPVEPERVKFLIEDVLERRADREANRIRVNVDEGEVTLTGAVNSWDEKKAILGSISHTPGVTAVRDHLFIDPYGLRFEMARAS
ncbi:MAG TPA: BON domain-containing protein [Blastocatellia bacterium]|nr:BON domain-containing protein [Blastocatellia bacterium]HMX26112.1 BON domain-containing protein [Blastocatellia bacterium]HMZ22470.1 BON domain-containing protein [Blastocatellia bacterium]HNG29911.1 BON domain-containing protein [Blastocatellia bacterium]